MLRWEFDALLRHLRIINKNKRYNEEIFFHKSKKLWDLKEIYLSRILTLFLNHSGSCSMFSIIFLW